MQQRYFKAILTTGLAPSPDKPRRIIAKDADKNRVTIPWPEEGLHGSGMEAPLAHRQAAQALCDKMEWKGEIVGGGWIPGQYVWVFTGD